MDKLKTVEINALGYGNVPKIVMQDRDLSITAKAIYAYLCSYTGQGICCFPGKEKMCYDLDISNNTICKHINTLIAKGYIDVEQIKDSKGRFSHNIYTINSQISASPYTNFPDTDKTVYGEMHANNNNIKNNSNFNNSLLKEKNTKKEKQTFITEFLDSIENAELREAYSDFIAMRKEIKAPITTQRMLNVLKNKLNSITQDTQKQIDLLNEAIFNKWKSVYPIKPKNAIQGKTEHNYGSFDLDKFEEKLNRD